ncbi:MAG: DUF2157 domain-containing protein [Chloroflexi bacterium]|nr:DUF2157 domain-containing protein [Chloroflexota bacterium]
MSALDSQLHRWQEAQLLDAETAERIRRFEGGRQHDARPGAVEAIVYLGIAVVAVGSVVVIAANWNHLAAPVRLSLPALSALIVLIIGWYMLRSPSPQLTRGGQLAWLLALALMGTTFAVNADELGLGPERNLLATGAAVTVLAAAFWLWSRTHAQVTGIAAGCLLVALGLAAVIDNDDYRTLLFGAFLLAAGAVGIALAELNLLRPRETVRLLSGLGALLGAFYSGVPPALAPFEAIGFVAGCALVALSIWRGVFMYMGFGVAVLFIALLTLVLRHVDDPTAAGLALTGMGLALLAGIVLLERLRPWARSHGQGGAQWRHVLR